MSGPNGASLSVPAGAAELPLAVVVAPAGVAAPTLPAGTTLASPTYEITPHGAIFVRSVEVAIPFDPAAIPAGQRAILLKAESGGDWAAITDVRVDGSMLKAAVTDLSYFAVASCASYASSTCVSGPSISIRIAAPAVSAAASAPLSMPPPGSGADAIAVVNEPTRIQLAVPMTLPAGCIAQGAALTLTVQTDSFGIDGDVIGLFREPTKRKFRPLAILAYTGTDPAFSVVGSRSVGGDLVLDMLAYVDLPGFAVLLDPAGVTASVTCKTAVPDRVLALDATPVHFLRTLSQAEGASRFSAPARIFESPSDVTVAVGQVARFFVSFNDLGRSGPAASYQWERSDDAGASWVPVEGAVQSRLVLDDVRPDDNGARFRAIAVRQGDSGAPAGAVVSDAATLTVVAALPATDRSVAWQPPSLVAAGGSATMAIRSDGTLWSWGADNGGVLGRVSASSTPQPVDLPGGVATVAGGAWYAAAALGNGDVYAWGWGGNVGAAIGSGNLDNPAPVKVAGLTGIRALSSRYQHTLALSTSGKVSGFGPESSGALGPPIGNDGVREISGLPPVRQVAAGEAHSLALLADGTVWAWGSNAAGQLGVSPTDVPRRAEPAAVPGMDDVIAIAASSYGSFALRRDGSVWSWGQAVVLGRTGTASVPALVPFATPMQSIGAGNYNVFALDAAGRAFGWGDNATGRVGVGSSLAVVAAPTPLAGLPAADQIAGGEGVGLALARDGRVFVWGGNGNVQIDGTPRADSDVPVDSGFAR